MAVSRKREQSDLKVDILIDDVLQHKNDQMNLDNEDHDDDFRRMSEHLERRLDEEDSRVVRAGSNESGLVNDTSNPNPSSGALALDGNDVDHKPTLDDILNEVDAKAKSKVTQAEELDQRRLTKAVNPIIKAKAEQSKKASAKGWVPFCVTLIVIGIVWMVVGFCTTGAWPIPFFGGWNMACGGFLIVYGGLMLLGWR